MARTATIEHTATGITITVENATGHYTFDRAADGTYIQGCGKCSGTGWLTYHLNVQGGVCFDCDGTGRLRTMLDADTARKWAIRTVQRQERAAVKAEAKRLERLAAAEAEARADDVAEQEAVAVFTAAHPQLAAALARHASADAFVNRMLATVKVGCDLSEKQHAAVERAVRDLDHADAIAIEQAERGFARAHRRRRRKGRRDGACGAGRIDRRLRVQLVAESHHRHRGRRRMGRAGRRHLLHRAVGVRHRARRPRHPDRRDREASQRV